MIPGLVHFGGMDALQEQAIALAEKKGRMAFANKIAEWAVANREALPAHLREQLANMIVKAGE